MPEAEALDAVVSAAILEGRTPQGSLANVVAAYRELLAAEGALDFDGLLAEAHARLQRDAMARSHWQGRYSHFLVDEFQDVDATQLELVAILAEPGAQPVRRWR